MHSVVSWLSSSSVSCGHAPEQTQLWPGCRATGGPEDAGPRATAALGASRLPGLEVAARLDHCLRAGDQDCWPHLQGQGQL